MVHKAQDLTLDNNRHILTADIANEITVLRLVHLALSVKNWQPARAL
jgi:hypothetical protein